MCRFNGPDMISMRQIYKSNDPYSLDLRIKVKELHELLEKVVFDWKSKRENEEFLQEIADKLWGWGKYEREETDGNKHTKIYKKMDVLEVTGAPGHQAEFLNGKYVETDQLHNDRKLYKKVSEDCACSVGADARVAARPCRPSVCPAGPTFTATFLYPEDRPLMWAATQKFAAAPTCRLP
jgi:hypothetical protein